MRSYWIWLILLTVAWAGVWHEDPEIPHSPGRVLGIALSYAFYFLCPLFRRQAVLFACLLVLASLSAAYAFSPVFHHANSPALYGLLVLTLLAGYAAYHLPLLHAVGAGLAMLAAAFVSLRGSGGVPPLFLLLYASLAFLAFSVFRMERNEGRSAVERYDALLSEYREERVARREERMHIAREIHDSVGHKLTALLMQLEVLRMKSDGGEAEQVARLKNLARESLEETRNAVRQLKREESGGLSAVLRLIRRLETENGLSVQFSVRSGALSVSLDNDQSVAVYRVIQEALTNAMRHGSSRQVEISFEVPGGMLFRFEVTNRTGLPRPDREGFGLIAMRERMESVGGRLEWYRQADLFIIRGDLPLHRGGEDDDDPHIAGRRPEHGPPGVENDDRNRAGLAGDRRGG